MKKKKQIRIGHVLAHLLKERGLSAKALSKNTGVSASTLSTWMSNSKPRNVDDVAAVAEALGVSLDYLLFEDASVQADITDLKGETILSGIYRIKLEKIILPTKK